MLKRRLIRELHDVLDLKECVTVRVIDPSNILHLQGLIQSPEYAPTANYIFFFDIMISREHPFKPPKVTATNKIWHPKIQPRRQGGICMAELTYGGCKPATNQMSILLLSLQVLLGNPGELTAESTDFLNPYALNDYLFNQQAYNKKALEWVKEDNEGYGAVQFEDHRLRAVQSILAVSFIIPYECHVFCCRVSEHCFRLTLIVVPSLYMYREKITPASGSIKLTQTEFKFKSSAMSLTASEDSLDKCWKIKMISSTFEKDKVDQIDPRKDPAPQCSGTIEWIRPECSLDRLIHKFYIKDCEDDTEIVSFDMCIDPESIPSASQAESSGPTLPLLLHFSVAPDKYINIAEEVGNNFDFGVHLLNDTNGKITESICSEERGSAKDVNRKVLMKWLDGQGKPVTWESLVSVLRSIQLNTLATGVENAVHSLQE